MNYTKAITEVIEDYSPLKFHSIQAMTFEIEDADGEEWPLNATFRLNYWQGWIVVLKFIGIRRAQLPIFGGGIIDLGDPSIHESKSEDFKGLIEFLDESKGYRIVFEEVLTLEVRRK
jgi:hypothetical protein